MALPTKFYPPRGILLLSAALLISFVFTCGAVRPKAQESAKSKIRFASFNIQVFGRKKASDASVMAVLVRILKRYDIVLVMEIRDSGGEAFGQLVQQTNRDLGANPFEYVISERTGRTSSKEQYAVMYRRSVAEVQTERTVSDSDDRFQREPYIVKLGLKSKSGRSVPLNLIGLHTEPDKTVVELEALYSIVAPMKAESLLIAGDLNADCSYVSRAEMANLKLRRDRGFQWLIDDSADTTVKSTNCAYDRLIVTDSAARLVAGPARVFRFDSELGVNNDLSVKVSDHYPVELDLSV